MSDSVPAPKPRLDPATMTFPTDRITLGAVRRNEPGLLDSRSTKPGHLAANEAFAAHGLELLLAEKAFAAARGDPDPDANFTRTEIIALLDGTYQKFGLSAGIHTTGQLARDLETAAAVQAQQSNRTSPGR
ncbi:MAG: hypothetical protein U0637_06795 [Phycisphaerales bacterium]